MRTRRAVYSSSVCGVESNVLSPHPLKRQHIANAPIRSLKKSRLVIGPKGSFNGFDALHDDVLLSILVSLSSSGSSPADIVNMMLTCKRFCAMGMHPLVLANMKVSALAVPAARWSDAAHRFLKRCADVGNVEACYTLGTIRFYCLQNRAGGASLMAKAAMASHAGALHSLAVIQFNGSGGTRKDKDLKAGVALCARAAALGHVDATRELGHCLQDGYGVMKNILEGRRLLLEANAREAVAAVASSPQAVMATALRVKVGNGLACLRLRMHHQNSTATDKEDSGAAAGKLTVQQDAAAAQDLAAAAAAAPAGGDVLRQSVFRLLQIRGGCALLSDFGCNVPPAEVHIANKFLVDWFTLHPPVAGLRLCSHGNCGRPETRRHEFRRCSACGRVNYCSRACQALDWKIRHKYDCRPVADWEERDEEEEEEEEEEEGNEADEEVDEDEEDDNASTSGEMEES